MPAQLNQRSGFYSGNCRNVNHQASTYQGACASEADREQTVLRRNDAAALSAFDPHEERDCMLKLDMCYNTGLFKYSIHVAQTERLPLTGGIYNRFILEDL